MEKREFIAIQTLLGVLYSVYLMLVVNSIPFWAAIVSPVCAVSGGCVILWALRYTERFRMSWLNMAAACLSWGVADVLWAWYSLVLKVNPNEISLFTVLYLLPNVFIMVSVISFVRTSYTEWQHAQVVLDISTTLLVGLSLAWILFFNQEFGLLLHLDIDSVMNYLYLLTDIISISLICVAYFSSAFSSRIPYSYAVIIFSIFLYSFADISYVYLTFNDRYVPNTLVDALYMGSLMLLACAACMAARWPAPIPRLRESRLHRVSGSQVRILLLAPLAVLLVKGFKPIEILFLVVLVALHQALSGYVQNASKNEELLKLEMDLNNQLENKINMRTMELTEVNKRLAVLSKQDDVTGLYNRRYFMESLDHLMDTCHSEDAIVVFFMDLDRFKTINDVYGHDMGDRVLVEIAARMERWKPKGMLLARMGGDEFVTAFPSRENTLQIQTLAQEVVALCSEPVLIPPFQFNLSVSIGVARYPMDAMDKHTLMKHADIAMYQAKESRLSQISFYSSMISGKVKRKHELEVALKKADYDQEFSLYYQPQFSIPSRKLIGVEALIRWKSPDVGMVSPGDFIPLAEESGAIVGIGDWVLKAAAVQSAAWNRRYGLNLHMGINISPRQMDGVHFIESLQTLIQENDIRPEWLDLEITESSTMNSEVRMEEILTALTGIGVSVSIDDFGTGYSSLSYIKRFDIDRLKIARELVDAIATDPNDAQIVRAIVLMAKGMELKTIAEGVETEEQLNCLADLGCDQIQGYLMGRPMPAAEFEAQFLQSS